MRVKLTVAMDALKHACRMHRRLSTLARPPPALQAFATEDAMRVGRLHTHLDGWWVPSERWRAGP
jgi:hypothetical protein